VSGAEKHRRGAEKSALGACWRPSSNLASRYIGGRAVGVKRYNGVAWHHRHKRNWRNIAGNIEIKA